MQLLSLHFFDNFFVGMGKQMFDRAPAEESVGVSNALRRRERISCVVIGENADIILSLYDSKDSVLHQVLLSLILSKFLFKFVLV